jgi:hypothetical protein
MSVRELFAAQNTREDPRVHESRAGRANCAGLVGARYAELEALLPRLKNGWHEPVPAATLEALSQCPVAGHSALAGQSP